MRKPKSFKEFLGYSVIILPLCFVYSFWLVGVVTERPIRVLLIYVFMVGLFVIVGKIHTWFLIYKRQSNKNSTKS